MTEDPSLDLILSRLQGGDSSAAQVIFHRFVHRLTALASRQFDPSLRGKTDPEDVVQSVYRSFFVRNQRAPFALADWDSLWALLASITVHKCLDRRAYWHAARRTVVREQAAAVDSTDVAYWEALDRGPTPLQATVLAELVELILGDLPAQHRAVGELSLQGFTAAEVADRCGCSERTVARVVARMKERLAAADNDDLDADDG